MNFPNQSRSYDATRRVVRFWGYDRSMKRPFFVRRTHLGGFSRLSNPTKPVFCVRSMPIAIGFT